VVEGGDVGVEMGDSRSGKERWCSPSWRESEVQVFESQICGALLGAMSEVRLDSCH
jgi:hypothetical protein